MLMSSNVTGNTAMPIPRIFPSSEVFLAFLKGGKCYLTPFSGCHWGLSSAGQGSQMTNFASVCPHHHYLIVFLSRFNSSLNINRSSVSKTLKQ